MRRRTLVYVLLALAVPLPALALTRGSAAPEASLEVTASLDSCGTASNEIVCKIDASWNSLPGATRYTARVTSPDGSVIDYGDVGEGATSLWVPYAGNGTYTVTVAAYGTTRAGGEPELLAKSSSGAGERPTRRSASLVVGGGAAADEGATDGGGAGDPGAESPDPACDDDPADDEETPADDPTADSGEEVPAAESTAPAVEAERATADATADDADADDPAECPEVEAAP